MVIFVIKEIRKKKNINLYRLSKLTGLTRSYLRDLENNRKNNPTLNTLIKIANAMDVKVKDLFYEHIEMDDLKAQLYESIDKYGLNAKETIEISRIIDLLVNVDFVDRNNDEKQEKKG